MKTVVVIPHHLPTLDFLNEWRGEFDEPDVHLIIVNDKPYTEMTSFPDWLNKDNATIYNHEFIDLELGTAKSWIIPRGTSAIRSYGLWKAWQRKPDMIVTLDNDCFPDNPQTFDGINPMLYFVHGHWKNLTSNATLDWVKSTPEGWIDEHYTRGFPYLIRNNSEVKVSHGLWSNIPDFDAAQMLLHPKFRTKPLRQSQTVTIPRNNFYTMCGMNLAFKPEVTPLMFFGLFGAKYGFDQFDDIWAGVFSKKIMDHLDWAVKSGYPSVEHRKQSNAFVNFKKQAGGIGWNEEIWKNVQKVQLTKDTPASLYKELIEKVELPDDPYFKKMRKATLLWLELFS